MRRKGLLLAGGQGTRLSPLTRSVSKQLLPIYNKPAIYYPLSSLLFAGCKEIAIISDYRTLSIYQDILGDGMNLGISLEYIVQPKPDGIAQAYILAEHFLDGDPSILILGDNLFYGDNWGAILGNEAIDGNNSVFTYKVSNPSLYGVPEIKNGKILNIEEKPENPMSDLVIPGIYFLDEDAPMLSKSLQKSSRGEYEIADLLNIYASQKTLNTTQLGRGIAWFDIGNVDSLLEASLFVKTLETRQGLFIGSIEEIVYNLGYVQKEELLASIAHEKSDYFSKLRNLISIDAY